MSSNKGRFRYRISGTVSKKDVIYSMGYSANRAISVLHVIDSKDYPDGFVDEIIMKNGKLP